MLRCYTGPTVYVDGQHAVQSHAACAASRHGGIMCALHGTPPVSRSAFGRDSLASQSPTSQDPGQRCARRRRVGRGVWRLRNRKWKTLFRLPYYISCYLVSVGVAESESLYTIETDVLRSVSRSAGRVVRHKHVSRKQRCPAATPSPTVLCGTSSHEDCRARGGAARPRRGGGGK